MDNDEKLDINGTRNIESKIKLGSCTNLVYGFNPNWFSDEKIDNNSGLFPATEPSMITQDISINNLNTTNKWDLPEITLHDNVYDLLTQAFPYKTVDLNDGLNLPQFEAGPLLLDDKDRNAARNALSKTLGIDLSGDDFGYALIIIKRVNGNAQHSSKEKDLHVHPNPKHPPKQLQINDDFWKVTKNLATSKDDTGNYSPKNVTIEDAGGYINVFNKYGTHYVSKVIAGDMILQIFKYAKEKYEQVKRGFNDPQNKFTGYFASNFQIYTTIGGHFGYATACSKIICMSKDKKFSVTLENKDWYESIFAKNNSIFAVLDYRCPNITYETLKNKFREITPITFELASLSLFTTINRKKASTRVLKAIMIQKYSLKPNFLNYCTCNCNIDGNGDVVYDPTGVISTIATPYIDIYKPTLNLSNIELVAENEVKTFTVFTNNLSFNNSNTVSIPGKEAIIMSSTINVSDLKYIPNINVPCNHIISSTDFLGGIIISVNEDDSKEDSKEDTQYLNNRYSLIDGLKYVNIEGKYERYNVNVVGDVRKPLDEKLLTRVKSDLEFSFVFSNSRININSNCIVKNALSYIDTIIPSTVKDDDLLGLKMRSKDLLLVLTGANGSSVPILPYSSYEKQVTSILDYVNEINMEIAQNQMAINQRKQAELIIDVGKDLNKNIIDSGKLLQDVISSNQKYQNDLAQYYGTLVDQLQAQYDKQRDTTRQLELELKTQQVDVDNEVSNYKTAVEQWETMEEIKFGLQVATDLFSVGTSIAVPASSITAVKDLGLAVQRIQKLLNILNNTLKVYNDIKSVTDNIQKANTALDGLDDSISTDLGWDEMSINFNYILASGPSIQAKNDLDKQFKLLILKGKAYTNSKSTEQGLAKEIYNNQKLQIANKDQSQRLKELSNTLQPSSIQDLDKSKVDLLGLTGNLTFIRNQTYQMLAKSFLLQDEALQYQYLQPTTRIDSFDILGFKGAIAKQAGQTNYSKSVLAKYQEATTTVQINLVKIDVNELINGGDYEFTIYPDNSQFADYFMVRVKSLVAEVQGGVKDTDSGTYHLKLSFPGDLFYDKSLDGKLLKFNTPTRERVYEYEVKSNEPKFTDKGESWSTNVSEITPFSTWKISFPKDSKNKNIQFNSRFVNILLTFSVGTRFNDANSISSMKMKEVEMKSDDVKETDHKLFFATSNLIQLPRAPAMTKELVSSLPSDIQLVTLLNNAQNVLNSWDVVLNMSLSNVNDSFNKQYELNKTNLDYGDKIDFTSEPYSPFPGDWYVMKYDINYGAPLVKFKNNSDTGTELTFIIIKGELTRGKYTGGDKSGPKGDITWADPESIANKTISAYVPLSQIVGSVEDKTNKNYLSVGIDLAKGAFQANEMDLSDIQQAMTAQGIQVYFTQHQIRFIINTIDLTAHSTLGDLIPSSFLFKVLETKAGNHILQTFIETNGRSAMATGFGISQRFINSGIVEPIPQGYQYSLMISNKILFSSILPQSLSKEGWTLGSKQNNSADSSSFVSSFTGGTVTGTVNLSSLNSSYTPPPPPGGGFMPTTYYKYRFPGGTYGGNSTVTYPISGMTLSPTSNGDIVLAYSQKSNQKIDQQACTYNMFSHNCGESHFNSDYTVNIGGIFAISVSGSDIKIDAKPSAVTIDAVTSGGGPCGSDDLQAQVNKQIKEQVPNQIVDKVNMSFTDVSVFAIKNLLFPDSTITLEKAWAPNVMLILGNFN